MNGRETIVEQWNRKKLPALIGSFITLTGRIIEQLDRTVLMAYASTD
ncbi:hypothetical protein M3194_00145 [Paenibacillus glycanilyticus]|nr:hypothetical protein [Paenibacillus glycanilyticus]MCM3625769.1 hypothetical protein [Paenibacillus glycanilyticus]